jgi:Holliday junction resolvasome RuvABC endonuclease subunit
MALDLSLSNSGVAVFTDDGKLVELLSIETNKDESHPLRLRLIGKKMMSIYKKYKVKTIVVETGFMRFNRSSEALWKVHGLINYLFYKCEQVYYHSTTVRKEVLGKGNAKKEEVYQYLKSKYPKIDFDDLDQVDAFALGLCYFNKKEVLNA